MKTQFEIFLNEFFETLEEELRFLKAKEIQEVFCKNGDGYFYCGIRWED